tara:strand:- start:4611 stop:4862 length:252 start_codon:yes stop_codon:yes gene_type:complete
MRVFLFVLYFLTTVESYGIRGYSVIWRNSENKVVKRVVFSKNTRLKTYFSNEKKELDDLEYGFDYFVKALESPKKIIIIKKPL